MVLHVASKDWFSGDVHTFEWQVLNFWRGSIFNWGVPVFLMISGALFLSRDIPVRKIYGKYIFRIFTALVFWSFIYGCADYAVNSNTLQALAHFVNGHYHMWFLFMIMGLYALHPFMKKIAASRFLTKYFLVIAFFFAFLFPEAVNFISLFSEEGGKFLHRWVNHFYLQFAGGFTGYFLLGFLLNNTKFSAKAKRTIYFLGIISAIAGMLLSVTGSMIKNAPYGHFNDYHTVNILLESSAIFVFFKSKFNHPVKIIRKLSEYSFGAYLIHPAFVNIVGRLVVGRLGLKALTFTPVISVPLTTAIVFLLSFGISAVLNHIPVIKKYIV